MSDDFLGYRRGPDEPTWIHERTDEWEALHPSLRYPGDTGRDQLPPEEIDDLAPRRPTASGRGSASVPPRSGTGVYPASARPADLPAAKPVSAAEDRGLPVPPPSGGGIRWSPPPAPGRRPAAARGRSQPGDPGPAAPVDPRDGQRGRGGPEQDPRYGPGRHEERRPAGGQRGDERWPGSDGGAPGRGPGEPPDERWAAEGRGGTGRDGWAEDGWGQDPRPVSPAAAAAVAPRFRVEPPPVLAREAAAASHLVRVSAAVRQAPAPKAAVLAGAAAGTNGGRTRPATDDQPPLGPLRRTTAGPTPALAPGHAAG
ncbi:hypothetical protein ACFQ1L_12840 [Phytohabitans flavus]|uniref:hypothetical protein n=1 Tax=Phytohabitans flavus TaxID=1076124 RepID=UPI003644BAF9